MGVNVFWRHLKAESYDRKDPYGNKDPVAAAKALQLLERALQALGELPPDYRDFYARRMVLRIQSSAYAPEPEAAVQGCGPAGTLTSSDSETSVPRSKIPHRD